MKIGLNKKKADDIWSMCRCTRIAAIRTEGERPAIIIIMLILNSPGHLGFYNLYQS
jgi:hypothetical protein